MQLSFLPPKYKTMKNSKYSFIDIYKLNTDNLNLVLKNLDLKSLKNLTKSSSCISAHIHKDLSLWQLLCNTKLCSINDCREAIKKKYLVQKRIKTGKGETYTTFHTNQKDITVMMIHNNYIYTSSDDASIKKYNFSGVLLKSFIGHKGGVWSFSIDRHLVTGSTDKTAIIWDLESGIPLHRLKGHLSTVRVVKIKGDFICTGGRDNIIRVWNLIGECLHVLIGHTNNVRCLDINNKYLLSGSYDGSVILWDYKKGKKIFNLKSHKSRVYCVLLGDRYIVSSGCDAYIHISTLDNKLIGRYKEHQFLVIGLSFTDNERYLVSSAADNALCKWDIVDNTKIYSIYENYFISSHFVYNDLLFITTQKELKVYDYNTGLYIRTILEADKFIKVEVLSNYLVVAYSLHGKYHIRIYKYN
ncbi:wd40 repeat-containing protein [Vairimorpha ceranae]|uniref:Wd40 repeat-containing protein n=1 Tax=Vairimorpha ceranae TaxID=40302 RepID=A0A0F9WCZ3_9MICR|nr:wd40 repeat-containing protein [Vairimorpha ceranae]KAF5140415.1 hypothetical protein G9O61_00g014310 [Vairimorpha ceranae]KKO74695.1 wd40 repeat-containing protein [Vairimorpha ceranae]